MRSHRRRMPLEHALVAGVADDLPGIATALAWLPSDAYGQVLVEADLDVDLSFLTAPARVTVQRVTPAADRPGLALDRAVAAWVEEWMPGEPDDRRTVAIWVGSAAPVDVHGLDIGGLAERW